MFGETQTHYGDVEDKATSKNESEQDLAREEDDYEETHMEEAQ
ncbi:hypothetical protein J1N35_034684 [Gossypium stocksii]|uniref:Uncharacterized protein n=1 Tax=Gossypium stocksii TaxID=47602 RepID=A0A9D3ZQ93_9ROSI|nr:hypothetical protein J1N35_034684 [Gossypium stocksii]